MRYPPKSQEQFSASPNTRGLGADFFPWNNHAQCHIDLAYLTDLFFSAETEKRISGGEGSNSLKEVLALILQKREGR